MISVNQLLLQYSYLQVLDFLSTIAFLLTGVREGNPLVRVALQYAPDPVMGLAMVKLVAILLGVYCWKSGRLRLLGRMNFMFAVVVAWNLVALIAGSINPA